MANFNCILCNESFYAKPSWKRKYCSRKCYIKSGTAIPPNQSLLVATAEQRLQRLRMRFEEHVIKRKGCWYWTGLKTEHGYGRMWNEGKSLGAHRASWILHKGEIGDLDVLHTCDNPPCTNPAHLFLGTMKDNVKDMIEKSRHRTKLNEKQVIEIKKLIAEGTPDTHIAFDYGVSSRLVFNIRHNKAWKHIQLQGLK